MCNNFFHFHAVFGEKKLPNDRLAPPPLRLEPHPCLVNTESSTEFRHFGEGGIQKCQLILDPLRSL